MWFLFALTSTFFYSFRRFSEKGLSEKIDHFTLGWAVQAFSLPLITVLLFFTTIPTLFSLSGRFWIPLLIIWFILYPLQAYFYYRSLKEGNVTYVLPLMSLIPIFNVLISWFLVQEIPSLLGFLSIIFIVIGVYFLNVKKNMQFLSPFTHLFRDRPSLFMIINCICLALGSTLDKIAIQVSNSLFYSFINTLGASTILLIIARINNKHFTLTIKRNFNSFLVVGILQALGFTSYIVALQMGIVSYVVAIKSANVILASIWGLLFLKETFNRYQTISFALIFSGLVLIAFA